FWMVFDFLTTSCGLYARALLPRLEDPVYAFPRLADLVLPPVALGFFYLGMIATGMSTIDAYAFIAAPPLARAFNWPLPARHPARIPSWSRYGLWFTCAFAAALAIARPSVVALWHDLGSVVTPVLLLPVLLALSRAGRPGPRGALLLMLVPAAVTLPWVLWK